MHQKQTPKDMETNIEKVKAAAAKFLKIADELNEKVSRYIDGSEAPEDTAAYMKVREADKEFIDAVNAAYEGNGYEYGLNYELAESFI